MCPYIGWKCHKHPQSHECEWNSHMVEYAHTFGWKYIISSYFIWLHHSNNCCRFREKKRKNFGLLWETDVNGVSVRSSSNPMPNGVSVAVSVCLFSFLFISCISFKKKHRWELLRNGESCLYYCDGMFSCHKSRIWALFRPHAVEPWVVSRVIVIKAYIHTHIHIIAIIVVVIIILLWLIHLA